MEKVLTKYVGKKDSHTLRFYKSHGGYEAFKKALKMKPEDIIEMVKQSGLRGRGGAGFPTGLKWSFVPKEPGQKYLCVNGDESEPGTFKDRIILEHDPHQLLEGCLICCYAVGIQTCYVYLRGEFKLGAQRIQQAIQEAYEDGLMGKNILGTDFSCDFYLHRGAGAYICGEETALLSSLEGGRGLPRIKPPFPAVSGLYGKPTIINNVETLANLPHILNRGVEWYTSIGPKNNTGPKLFCFSGHVEKPGCVELPMGIPLREMIDKYAGGVWKGKKLKAVIPGGSSVPILHADECDVPMDFDSLQKAGSMLGSAAIIVMDEDTCIVDALYNLMRFYHHESCGQCTPCREGTGWLEKIVARIEKGHGRPEDLELLDEIGNNMVGKTICVLADAAVMPCQSYIKKFRDEFQAHIEEKGCPFKKSKAKTA
ncbi:MAG: NADH oxidoreductase (quinone) subunit F [Planctomycetota bacterium]|nr:MAG: NADH oxidoreductase (quinone) subunit F [Planctomycetota bacterium]